MKSMRRFFRYVKPYVGQLLVTLLLGMIFSLSSAASIYMVLPILDLIFPAQSSAPDVSSGGSGVGSIKESIQVFVSDLVMVPGDPRRSLLFLCLLVVAIFLLKNVVKFISNVMSTRIQQHIINDVRNDLYNRLVRQPLKSFHERRSGELISIVTSEVDTINSAFVPLFIKLTREPLEVIILLVLLLALSPLLTLIAFSSTIATLLLIRLLRHAVRKYSLRMQNASEAIMARLQESIQNVRIIKGYGAEAFEMTRFKKETDRFTRNAIKHSLVVNLTGPIGEIVSAVAIAVVLFYGGSQVLAGTLAAEELVTFLLLLFSIMSPVVSLIQIPSSMQRGVVASERVFALYDQALEIDEGRSAATGVDDRIRFENVDFAYREGLPVLTDISFDVPRGTTVALVGPSGGGKSTLVDLLLRFYRPGSGRITLDGKDINDYELQGYRRLFGIVTQESLLFNDTVRSNIAYTTPEATDEQIENAARIAHAHDFISALPDGYLTKIGDRGVLLSGGERQRIAIARAVLADPAVLLLDEATSALDNESERYVRAAIASILPGRTAVIIAHRLSTIMNADTIIVIDHGRIAEMGTHAELLEKRGLYEALQNAGVQEEFEVRDDEGEGIGG